ncbi:MAG: hypothetical protein JSV05_07050 [Candidatus Bathyarchaeota archaeon]|nr:MAG: hypothetical protein JSV05_07050 [Candidatus Bathyarchaeota archaeon]
MKKLSLFGMFTSTFLISCFLGLLISSLIAPFAMAVKAGGKSSKLQLQFRNGTTITSYNWGDFEEGQAKRLDCQLTYTGKKPVQVLWNTTNFPFGWRIRIWLEFEPKQKWWIENTTKSFITGETRPIQIILEEINGIPSQNEFFTLNFMALVDTKKTN